MNTNEIDFLKSFLSELEIQFGDLQTKLLLVEFSDSRYMPGPGQRLLAEDYDVYLIVPRLIRKCIYHAKAFASKLKSVIENDIPPIFNEPALDAGAASAVNVDEAIYFEFDSFAQDVKTILENNVENKVRKALHPDFKLEFRALWKTLRKEFGPTFLDVIRNEVSHIEFWGSSLAQTVNVVKTNGKLSLIFPSNFYVDEEKTDIAHLFVETFRAFIRISEDILVIMSRSQHRKFDQQTDIEIDFRGVKVLIPGLTIIERHR